MADEIRTGRVALAVALPLAEPLALPLAETLPLAG